MRVYYYNGRRLTPAEYAEVVSDLIARGHCLHAEGCTHETSPFRPKRGTDGRLDPYRTDAR